MGFHRCTWALSMEVLKPPQSLSPPTPIAVVGHRMFLNSHRGMPESDPTQGDSERNSRSCKGGTSFTLRPNDGYRAAKLWVIIFKYEFAPSTLNLRNTSCCSTLSHPCNTFQYTLDSSLFHGTKQCLQNEDPCLSWAVFEGKTNIPQCCAWWLFSKMHKQSDVVTCGCGG